MFLHSAHRVELEVYCDYDWWSHLRSTRSRCLLQRRLLVLRVETLHWNLRSLRSVPALEWVLGIRSRFVTILLYHLRLGRWIHHFLTDQHFLCFDSPRVHIWCIQRFQIFQVCSQEISFPNSPRDHHRQESYQEILSCQIDEFSTDLSVKTDDIQPLLQKELLALWVVLQIVFHTEFSRLPGGLGRFADSNNIP